MGKVVILGGNARSGKSTLAYKLAKKGFSRISLDNIESAIEDGLEISMDDLSANKRFNFFENIVNKALEEAELEDVNTVIDMYDFLPEDIDKLKNKDKIEVYFLAYPNCTLENIKYNVIHYAKPTDWIAQVNEGYLDECVRRFDERNKILMSECSKYHMNLVDTKDGDNREKAINELLLKITNKA